MATVTLDTHPLVRKLKKAGFNEQQAEALTDARWEPYTSAGIATLFDLREYTSALKSDFEKLETRLRHEMDFKFAKVDGEMRLLKWMLVVLISGVASLVLKTFF